MLSLEIYFPCRSCGCMREAASDVDSLYPKGVGPGSEPWIDGNGLGCVCSRSGLFPCVWVFLARLQNSDRSVRFSRLMRLLDRCATLSKK
jgi:hypothetical protein